MSKQELKDANFGTGAVRSADVDHLDFSSLPLIGLLGVINVGGNGGIKYGRHNYAKGMPVHVTLNHVAIHLIRYLLGDRTEDHLSKVAWGAMVANQTAVLQPELADPYLLGPGASLTAALLAEMDAGKEERDRRRQAGEFESLFNWTLGDMPEVQEIIRQRIGAKTREAIDDFAKEFDFSHPGYVQHRPIVPLPSDHEYDAAREALERPPTTVAPGHSIPLRDGEMVLLSGPAAIHGGNPEAFLGGPNPKG